ncbi:NADP-dependent oxidoreductase [Granulosicoccaceae sp. 1_MG-2023]|nr:NADP-dependent oxidoreductase [Granulosicoccaceae sp. 1_MG-2023]
MTENRQILLSSRPLGLPKSTNFQFVQGEIPSADDGELLCRTLFLSVDVQQRPRMAEKQSPLGTVEIGEPMAGTTISEVVVANAGGFAPGDIVVCEGGWQDYAAVPADQVRKLDPQAYPPSWALGLIGEAGLAAKIGIERIARPQAGETVMVSSAAGVVGGIAGQLAKRLGCRVVGVAGSPAKCDYVVNELGFDACINYKSDGFLAQLQSACPDGVNVYFDNVGGRTLEAAARMMVHGTRVVVCGGTSWYNVTELPPGPDRTLLLLHSILLNRGRMEGFCVADYADEAPAMLAELEALAVAGELVYREEITDGLESAPEALKGIFIGRNTGKQVVRVATETLVG